MRKKIIIGFTVLTVILNFSFLSASGSGENIPSDKEALIYIQQFKYHAMKSIVNYLYFSRGIYPDKTPVYIDKHLAQAEYYLLMLEKYSDHYPELQNDFKNLTSYWYNIRVKLVHTFNRKYLNKFVDYLEKIIYNANEMARNIITNKKVGFTETELNLYKTLMKPNYILFTYIVYFINPENPKSKTLLEKSALELGQWVSYLKNQKFKGDDKKWRYILQQLKDLSGRYESADVPTVVEAENLYLQVEIIENDILDYQE